MDVGTTIILKIRMDKNGKRKIVTIKMHRGDVVRVLIAIDCVVAERLTEHKNAATEIDAMRAAYTIKMWQRIHDEIKSQINKE